MQKLKFLGLFILLITGKVLAGDETRSSRVYANQLAVGSFIQTHDDKYTGSLPSGYTNYGNRGLVEFGIDEDKHTIMSGQALRVKFDVLVTHANLSTSVFSNQELSITYNPNEQTRYKDKAQITYTDAYDLKVYNISIYSCNISTPESSPCTTAVYRGNDVYLQAEITTVRLYDFLFNNTFTSGDLQDVILTPTRELQIDWNYLKGAEEYELEYTWVNNYSTTYGSYLPANVLTYDLEHDATRISTPYNQYKIPLTYESGYIVYRIRPVGRNNANVRMDGAWFGAPASGPTVQDAITSGYARLIPNLNNDALNWQSTKTFAELGKTGTGVSASDGLGHTRQSLARLNTDQKTIAQSTLYDFYGRPAINILPSPVTGLDFNYRFNLNIYAGGEFEKNDFDLITTSNLCSASGLVLDNSLSTGAARYYSSQNSYKEGYQGYVPDANGLPYTQVKLKPDALGRVTTQTMPGVTHQLGSGKEIKNFYSKPTQVELDRLFGSEAPRASNCFKNYVKDPNGQMSTTYIDQYGRTLATALLGNSPFNVDSLPSLPLSQIFTDNLITSTSNHADVANKCMEVNTTFFIAEPSTPMELLYKTTLGEFGSGCLPNLCFDCLYNLEISIKNDCGDEMFDFDNSGSTPPGFNEIIGGVPPYAGSTCNGVQTMQITGSSLDVPIVLSFANPGTYSIYKKICVSDAPIADYTEEFIHKQTCKDPCFYVDSLMEAADFSGCGIQTCADCLTSISNYTISADSIKYRSEFNLDGEIADPLYDGNIVPRLTAQQLSSMLENCHSLCGPANECEKLENQLLADFYPGTGQYAQTDPTDPRWTGSIMNPANTLFSGYDWASPTNYVRADGQADFVEINGNLVSPQALNSDDYQLHYRKSWARAFLTKHPEYCKLYFNCNVLGSSLDYDKNLKEINHYDTICTAGLIYPLGTLPGTVIAPPNSSCGTPATDPIFTGAYAANASVIAFKGQLLNNLFGNTNQSIYHYVAMQFYSTLPGSYIFGQDECFRDAMWDMFRSLYLTKKQELYNTLYSAFTANPSSFGLPGSVTCVSVPSGYTKRISDGPSEVLKDISGGPALLNSIIANNNPTDVTTLGNAYITASNATLAAHSASTCAGYETLWRMNLNTGCPAFAAASATDKNNIIAAMVGVCQAGSDINNPDGASTVISGSPYLIMPGSIAVNSFQDVLDYYLGVNACYSGLITMPPPYPYNSPGISGANPLSSCHCDQVLQNSASFQTLSSSSSLPPGVTNEWQLFRHVNGFDLPEYYSLKCFCNSAVATSPANSPWNNTSFTWNGTQLTALAGYPLPVSPKLKCSSCFKCSDVVTAITNLVLPSAASAFTSKLDKILNDSVNTYYSLAKLNNQFGTHSLRFYFDLFEDCKTFNSSHADTTLTFKNTITPEALDLFRYLNQLVDKRNLEKNARPLSICQDDKYYLSGIYGGSLPAISALTYNYTIVGNTLTFNLQTPALVTVLSVALTLPVSYTGTWDDLRQLNDFVAWCPSPVAGPNYGFKVKATDASFNSVLIQGQVTNAAFPISNLSSGGSPVPSYCPPEPQKLNTCAATLINNALVQGRVLFEQQAQALATTFQDEYKQSCFDALSETFYRNYKFTREYNYTLYYYDEAGNLQRTVAPNGVQPLGISTNLPASPLTYPLHALGNTIVNNQYVSDYRFNAYNQPVKEITVDGGATNYLYDVTGRILASQNAKQAAVTGTFVYSYTLYDQIGRITETGEMGTNTNLFATPNVNSMAYNTFTAVVNSAYYRRQVNKTYYDSYSTIPVSSNAISFFGISGNALQNLRNRVAAVTYVETLSGSNYNHATFYSYDDHGNVSFLVQEDNTLAYSLSGPTTGFNMQFKRIDYEYDLVSGNMLLASYQFGQPDHLSHKYFYDADNRLHEVFTSKDNINWDRDAKYFYYEHGPLARIERAEKKVQGTDYYYTIHGWLKGVNSDVLQKNNDAGKDGAATAIYASNYDKIHGYFAKDAMAFALNYYNNTAALATNVDYKAIKDANYNGTTDITPLSNLSNLYNNAAPFYLDYLGAGDGASLFNGNISSMVTSFIDKNPGNTITDNTPFPQITAYRYDQLHRIKAQKAHRSITGNTWDTPSGSNYFGAYLMGFNYDKNGNLLLMTRSGTDNALVLGSNTLMDYLQYNYKTTVNGALVNSNQAYGIFDAAGGSAYTEDFKAPGTPLPYTSPGAIRYTYDEIGNLTSDVGEYIASIGWTVDRKVQTITRDAAAMLLTGTGVNSVYKPDIEYVYNAMRQRVTKIVKPRDQVTKALKPEIYWAYTHYVYDASGNVMATYNRKTEYISEHYKVSMGLGEHHIYGSNRLALTRPAQPVEWYYNYNLCGGGGEFSDCRTILSTYSPETPTVSHYLGYKEFELNNHLGNVITTVSDRKIWALSSTTDYFVSAPSLEGWNYYPGVFSSNIPPTLLSLSTSSPYAALEKLINTVPGKSYRVKYNLVNPAGCAVEGEAYPVPVVPPFLINVPAAPGAGTSLNEFIFTATSAQTLIRIQRGVDGLGSQIFSLDYVTIEETAEYLPDQLMHTDYYAFGQQMPGRTWVASDYRYGMNGQEKQDELFKGANSAEFWMYDSRIGRRWERDPLVYETQSPYAAFNNNPIYFSDHLGLEGEEGGTGNGDHTYSPRNQNPIDNSERFYQRKEGVEPETSSASISIDWDIFTTPTYPIYQDLTPSIYSNVLARNNANWSLNELHYNAFTNEQKAQIRYNNGCGPGNDCAASTGGKMWCEDWPPACSIEALNVLNSGPMCVPKEEQIIQGVTLSAMITVYSLKYGDAFRVVLIPSLKPPVDVPQPILIPVPNPTGYHREIPINKTNRPIQIIDNPGFKNPFITDQRTSQNVKEGLKNTATLLEIFIIIGIILGAPVGL